MRKNVLSRKLTVATIVGGGAVCLGLIGSAAFATCLSGDAVAVCFADEKLPEPGRTVDGVRRTVDRTAGDAGLPTIDGVVPQPGPIGPGPIADEAEKVRRRLPGDAGLPTIDGVVPQPGPIGPGPIADGLVSRVKRLTGDNTLPTVDGVVPQPGPIGPGPIADELIPADVDRRAG